MSGSIFVLTRIERVALETIREERPEIAEALLQRLPPVLADLGRTSQGRVVTEIQVDELFLQLRRECVGRMLAEMEPWGEDEDLREPAVELLTRHLLAEVRAEFVRQVVALKRN